MQIDLLGKILYRLQCQGGREDPIFDIVDCTTVLYVSLGMLFDLPVLLSYTRGILHPNFLRMRVSRLGILVVNLSDVHDTLVQLTPGMADTHSCAESSAGVARPGEDQSPPLLL